MDVALGHEPPFALDGSVAAAKALELIQVQTELKWLDYKRECDLTATSERVEFAKDAGAMQIAGGYVLFGVDDDGSVVGLSAGSAALFDEAKIRDKLDKYMGPGFEVRSAVHRVDVGDGPRDVAIVWLAPHPDGCNVFSTTGSYVDSNGKDKVVFRQGDVFARHGSKSERWNQADRAEANRNRDLRARDQWRADSAEEFRQTLHAATAAATVLSDPAPLYTWQLDAAGFDAATVELMRKGDDVPLRTMLRSAQAEIRRLVSAPVGRVAAVVHDPDPAATAATDTMTVVLDRVTTVAALALDLDRPAYFHRVCEALAELYSWSAQDIKVHSSEHGLVPLLWLRIAERLYALGGLAVRVRNWKAVRSLAVLDTDGLGSEDSPRTWHRDALTQSSRASRFNITGSDGRAYEASLLMFARAVAVRLPALRPDLPEPDDRVQVRDELLASICAFDLLAAVVASSDADAGSKRDVLDVSYPNFARHEGRYDRVVSRMLSEPDLRAALVGSVSDATLARVLALVDAVARQEGARFFGWDGYHDEHVRAFIATHSP